MIKRFDHVKGHGLEREMKIEKGAIKVQKQPLKGAAAATAKKAVVLPKKVAPIAKAKAPTKGAPLVKVAAPVKGVAAAGVIPPRKPRVPLAPHRAAAHAA